MANVHIYHAYKLKEGKSEQDFLRVADIFSNEPGLKTKGFISWTLLNDGEMWADVLVYASMEDFENAREKIHEIPSVHELSAFFDQTNITENVFTVAVST